MAIDPQKIALYADITNRAGLYSRMLMLQRNDAPPEEIDGVIAAIGIVEAEIRRQSDEINDRIWYQNYGKMLALLEKQSDLLPQVLEGQKETHGSIVALSGRFQLLAETVSQLEQDLRDQDNRHGGQIATLSADLAIVKKIVEERPAQRKAEAEQYESRQAALEARQADLEQQLREMRGDYSPEQRQRYAAILMQIIAEWEAEHGDGN